MLTDSAILQHYKGYEELISRLDDYVYQAERYQKARLTPFLRLNEIEVVRRYLGERIPYYFDGGYENAEMKRAVIGSLDADSEVVCLCADISNRMMKIEHRDLYGALMHLSIRREQFGDVFIKDGTAVIYTTKEIANVITDQLTQIGRQQVSFKLSAEPVENDVRLQEFQRSVANYRLDAIVAAMANISREKAQALIKGKQVSINHEICEAVAHGCADHDVISIRGSGRFVILETVNVTKKNRFMIR